jgi:trehalose/maltose hydrolase-like predicted phosphorylase
VKGTGGNDLPAYVANGLLGLRVRPNALSAGVLMVSGFSGEHPVQHIEAAAEAPYPLAVDIALNGIWMSDVPSQVTVTEQAYDFAAAELTTDLVFAVDGIEANIRVLTFCSRDQPTIVCQEVSLRFNSPADVKLRAMLDGRGVDGGPISLKRNSSGLERAACDGVLRWESAGGFCTCGIAYVTQVQDLDSEPERPTLHNQTVVSEHSFRARSARTYRLRQFASVVTSAIHQQPDDQAVRLLGKALRDGFDKLREANRAVWADLWRSRIRLVGADERWQAMSDAAFYYLNSSVHASSPASTSMFGLSTWRDYHYYYGHVMWDIEAFAVPPISFFQPSAAEALLGYRSRMLTAAHRNAQVLGRRGAQFPWESAPSTGEEATPMPGAASWYEDHVSLDVALAFAFYADVAGKERFLRDYAWPVLSGVSDWLASRVSKTERGYEILQAMGIAEREEPADNAAFTNMAAKMVLDQAADVAARLGRTFDPAWNDIREGLILPRRGDVVVSHDGFRMSEDKGATPDPLMGIFPGGYKLEPAVERATLELYLAQVDKYIGAPMLSALFGVWAAWTGDRELAAKLLDEGYGRFCTGRFMQTLEYRPDVFPDEPRASPFIANIGGFLTGLLLGFPGIRPSSADPQYWPERPVVLPAGWDAIEIDSLWVRGRRMSLTARSGADRAILQTEPN